MNLSRRHFIVGAAACGGAMASYWLIQPQKFKPLTTRFKYLSSTHAQLLRALAPAMLAGVDLSSQAEQSQPPIDRLINNIDVAIGLLPHHSQTELNQLLTLLSHRGSFILLGQTTTPLPEMTVLQRDAMLRGWQLHSLKPLNQAYLGLHELFMAAWYGDPLSWGSLNYQLPNDFHENQI